METMTPRDVALARLEDQIGWYDGKSGSAQRWYKAFTFVATVSAALVPLLAGAAQNKWLTGIVGVVVLVCNLLLRVNAYEQNWINYRSTCEALKHEKFLFLAKAGPYKDATTAVTQLAERVESLVSVEHAKWLRNVELKQGDGEKA
jgi:hypothetical protein